MDAFKSGVTPIDEINLNRLITGEASTLVYEGSVFDSKTGAGIAEFDVTSYNYAVRITTSGVTKLERLVLEISGDGNKQDLSVEVRDNLFNPDGSAIGNLLRTVLVPKEFIPDSAAEWSIPINLSGLITDTVYWIIIPKIGDATDHFHLTGEESQDPAHPCYQRAGDSGAWALTNSIHYKCCQGDDGKLTHRVIPPSGHSTIVYDGSLIDKSHLYIPPPGATAGGIRKIWQATYSGTRFKSWT